jgi:hypothetical protein
MGKHSQHRNTFGFVDYVPIFNNFKQMKVGKSIAQVGNLFVLAILNKLTSQ